MEVLENRALALLEESWRSLPRELRHLSRVLEDGRGSTDEQGSFPDPDVPVSSAKGKTYGVPWEGGAGGRGTSRGPWWEEPHPGWVLIGGLDVFYNGHDQGREKAR